MRNRTEGLVKPPMAAKAQDGSMAAASPGSAAGGGGGVAPERKGPIEILPDAGGREPLKVSPDPFYRTDRYRLVTPYTLQGGEPA